VSPAFDDLTARARIRDAALRLFAERGMDAATVRDIARAAGVSPGLVRHHFGSKEALRDACDAYALDRVMNIKEQAVVDRRLAVPGFMPSMQPTILLMKQYVARAMLDGSPAAAAMFDDMVDLTEAWLAKHNPGHARDPRAFAAVLVSMNLGMLVMHSHLTRVLGADVLAPEGHIRTMRAAAEVMSKPLIDADLASQIDKAFDLLESEPPAKEHPDD
jgi:AcrR family transcriptional regulator